MGSSENGCNVSLIERDSHKTLNVRDSHKTLNVRDSHKTLNVRDSHKTVVHRSQLLKGGGELKRAFYNGNAKKWFL